ncbi:MAG: hypothetical protein F4Y13_09995, partial [Acidimicrobiaceae bacterium]|nr:hypothetical protein [Acidimicrobiaceae bacterium]
MRASVVRYLALGVLMVGLAAIAWTTLGGDGADDAETATNTTVAAEVTTTAVVTTTVPPEPIEVLGTADTLTDLDGWLNTDATSLEEIRAT